MSRTIEIALGADRQRSIVFPGCCVGCGGVATTQSPLVITRLVARGRVQAPVTLRYLVPHCERCARSTKATFLATFIPFLLGFVSVGSVALFVTWKGVAWLDDYGRPVNANSLVIAAGVGLVAGLLAGFVFEFVARILLFPVFGRALFQAPPLLVQFFTDAESVAGLTARPNADATVLRLTLANESIAREFEQLNRA
jgi:hypothetical protein